MSALRVSADRSRCCGAGLCAALAPETFTQSDDDGTVIVLDATPPAERSAAVRAAVRRCPSQAIQVLDTPGPRARPDRRAPEGAIVRSRYVHATRRGGPGVLAVREREMAVLPAPGEALVRVAAAGVSYGDILLRVGVIPGGPKPPFTPGFEIAGVVEATGEGVTGLAKGQAVAGLVRNGGGVGTAFLQLARLGGIQVHATASAAKHDLIRELGGHPIDYRGADFVAVTREQTGAEAARSRQETR